MKLHLPSLLLTAILATFTSLTASAAVVGTGVSYDNGKGSDPYSKNEAAHVLPGFVETDTLYCWANSAANMIQYWQDSYREVALTQDAPNGYNETVYNQPYGTRYLNVYEYYLQNGLVDKGGTQKDAINWYFRQTPIEDGALKDNGQSFMQGMGAPDVTYGYYGGGFIVYDDDPQAALTDLTTTLESVFSKQGQIAGLAIWQQDPADADREWEDLQSRSHAVTCWGYEKDAEGNVNALYLSDSDDMAYGVFKVHLTLGKSVPLGDTPSWDAILLQTDDQIDGYGGFVVNLTELFAISPNSDPEPEEGVTKYYKDYAKDAEKLPTLNPEENAQTVKVLEANTLVSGDVSRTGAGVKVGKDVTQGAPEIVMLVSESADSSLTLVGGDALRGTGLEVKEGSLASVANLSVSGYERGVNAEGKVYLYGKSVNVHGNALSNGDGAGIHNTNYVEIKDATEVNITGNSATSGRGGGIYNGENATTSIRGNAEVIFSGNSAAQGNDIYNAKGGSVNIADNGSVVFEGQNGDAAIVNDGTLYLKSGTDGEGSQSGYISFYYSSLDTSGGTTYVGQDIKGETAVTSLYFLGEKGGLPLSMELSSKASSPAAMLDHLTVTAERIIGAGAQTSSIKNADVTVENDLTLSGLTIDSSSTFSKSDWLDPDTAVNLTLDNLVIDLSALTMTDGGYGPEFDISGMFNDFGNITANNVYLDASSFELYKTWNELDSFAFVNFGEMLQGGTKLALLLGNDMMTQDFYIGDGGNVSFWGEIAVPEPATGTLSLLALAGLAARRRRK